MSDDKVELFSSSGGLAILVGTKDGYKACKTYYHLANMLDDSCVNGCPLHFMPPIWGCRLSFDEWNQVLQKMLECIKEMVAILKENLPHSQVYKDDYIFRKIQEFSRLLFFTEINYGTECLLFSGESMDGTKVLSQIKQDFDVWIESIDSLSWDTSGSQIILCEEVAHV